MGVAEARALVGSWGPEPPQIFGSSLVNGQPLSRKQVSQQIRFFNVPLLIWNAYID